MALIAPSILSANFANLERDFDLLNQSACDYIHIDVMDGHYVNNLTFGPPVISHLRPLTKKPFDVHLMIDRPERSLKSYKEAGALKTALPATKISAPALRTSLALSSLTPPSTSILKE